MDRLIIETTYAQPFSQQAVSTGSPMGKILPLAELQQRLTHLRQELGQGKQLISEQEEELTEYEETIAYLEKNLKIAKEVEVCTLEKELARQRQKKKKLVERLTVQRRYIQLQEAFIEQCQQMLPNQTQLKETETKTQEIDDQSLTTQWKEAANSPENPPKTKPRWWQWAIALPIVGLLVTGVTNFSQLKFVSQHLSDSLTSSSSPSPVLSNPKPTSKAVAALGYLEPKGEVIQVSAPGMMDGVRVEELLVQPGSQVKRGQMIAVLDNRDRLLAELHQATSQVKIAEARLAQVSAGAKQGDIAAQRSKFQGSQAELEGQINTQKSTIASLNAQLQGEREAQLATIGGLQAQLDNAQSDCQRYEFLYEAGGASQQSRDNICLQEKTTREQLKEAQATLNRIVTTRQEQIQEARANLQRTVDTQKSQISAAKATLEATAQVRPEDVQVAQAELEATYSAVEKAKADLKFAYVTAPKDGQILKIHTWPGEMVNRDKGILELGQTSQMYVMAEVYETDIARVKVGQQAIIKADGVVEDLEGTVDEIGLQIGQKNVLGTDPIADVDARVVEVKIRLNSQHTQRVANLTNLQVNVIINSND